MYIGVGEMKFPFKRITGIMRLALKLSGRTYLVDGLSHSDLIQILCR